MITAEEFRRLIFESPDLSILAAFARDVTCVRTEHFCEVPEVRESARFEITASSSGRSDEDSPVSQTLLPIPPTAAPPSSSRPKLATTPTMPQSKNQIPQSSSTSAVKEAAPFVFGDFGAFSEQPFSTSNGLSTTNSSNGTPSSTSSSRRSSRHVVPPASGSQGDELTMFGDFSYFVPKAEAPNKMEQSFNRSMMRRTSVVHHKVLDELEEATDEHETDSPETFSFSDFSLSSPNTYDDSPAARGFRPEADSAFMFGDFMVEMPESDRPPPKAAPPKPPAKKISSSTTSSMSPLSLGSSSGRRTIRRPLVVHGTLVKDVLVKSVLGHPSRIRGAVLASTAENCIVSCGGDHHTQLRSLDGTHPLCMYFGHQDVVLHIAISSDLNLIATSGSDNLLCIFEVATSKRVGDCTHSVAVLCSSFSKNGKYVVSGSHDGICRLWASRKKNQSNPMSNYFGHKSLITCVAFQPNGELVASGSGDTQVHIWSASTAKAQHCLSKLHTTAILNVAFNAEGTFVLSCDTTRVALTDVKSSALLASLDANSVLRPPSLTGISGKLLFTNAAFTPSEYANYFFVSTTDRSVSLYEFLVTQNQASPKSTKKATDKNAAPDISVTVSPEIWSCESRHRVTSMSTGPKNSVVIGDLGGNIAILTLVPRQLETNPPPKKVKPSSPKSKERM